MASVGQSPAATERIKKLIPFRLSPGQTVRILFGIASLATVVWVTVPHLVSTISTQAVVNARVFPLITPIRGTLKLAPPEPGTLVKKDDLLAIIEDRSADRLALDRSRAGAAALKDRIAARKRTVLELDRLKQTLEYQRDRYQNANIARLSLELVQSEAALRSAIVSADETARRLARISRLRSKGVVSIAAMEAARANNQRAGEEVAQRQAVAQRITGELEALGAGVFAARDRNDVPYSQQRIDEIELRQVEIRSRLDDHAIRVRELREIISNGEAQHLEKSIFELYAPTMGVIWRTTTGTNGTLAENGRIGTLIDCSNLILNVVLHERYFEDIHPGDVAEISVIGSDDVLQGRVESLRGMGASSEYDLLAARVPEIEARHFLATLRIDFNDPLIIRNGFVAEECGAFKSAFGIVYVDIEFVITGLRGRKPCD